MLKNIKRYLIIGNGRLASHLAYYFSSLNISFELWHRKSSTDLSESLFIADTVLLAISDSSIELFIDENNKYLKGKVLIHFSGALYIKNAIGCHPMMSFTKSFYEKDFYKKILFVIDENVLTFPEIFPQLPNPYITIPANKKALYHALCVMANNFTCFLWEKFFREMIDEFNAKAEWLNPFLERTASNISEDYSKCLTGPLVRGDTVTVNKNLESLKDDSFFEVYQSFVNAYQKEKNYESK